MLVKRLIEEIIDNFHRQHQLYLHIADLSCKQLAFLADEHWLAKQEELNELLKNRQAVNKRIDVLNSHNKSLQEQVTVQLGLPEFVLSHLESKLDEAQYKHLRDVVTGMGDILAKINKTDEQNHILLKKQAGTSQSKHQVNHQQAQDAYHQAVQQGKKS